MPKAVNLKSIEDDLWEEVQRFRKDFESQSRFGIKWTNEGVLKYLVSEGLVKHGYFKGIHEGVLEDEGEEE